MSKNELHKNALILQIFGLSGWSEASSGLWQSRRPRGRVRRHHASYCLPRTGEKSANSFFRKNVQCHSFADKLVKVSFGALSIYWFADSVQKSYLNSRLLESSKELSLYGSTVIYILNTVNTNWLFNQIDFSADQEKMLGRYHS